MISFLLLTALSDPSWSAGEDKKLVLCSYYGAELAGRPMANGDIFNPEDPTTVAHKTLPFGTKVTLQNPENHRIITVEVRDRGPYITGREFDLSQAAAHKLDMVEKGIAPLKIMSINKPRLE